PVGPIGNGETVRTFEQFRERGVYVPAPHGRVVQPRPPYRLGRGALRPFAPAPRHGEPAAGWAPRPPPSSGDVGGLPFTGLRVLDNLGLRYEDLARENPRLVMVRMPAFGLDGPWRDRTGFAQTMEQISGLAWVTGFADGPPVIPRGPCDPLAGLHAALALLVALEHRRRTGEGQLVESTMVEAALNATADQVLEWQAYGRLLGRDGNR